MKWRWSVVLLITGLCAESHSQPPQYHFISTPLPWLMAQMYCRERYTDLATIFDIEDMNRLVNTAQDSTGGFKEMAWIGLYDNLTSWQWSFADSYYYGDRERDYRNWGIGQPDNFAGIQMCVKTWGGGTWEDAQCTLRYPFICYDGSAYTSEPFVFIEQEMSWYDAQLYCREIYTDLASVRNEMENLEIQRLSNDRGAWIGLHRRREWSDGSSSTYRNWMYGQPDNFRWDEYCTAADLGHAGLWSDEECHQKLAFVCYGDNDPTPYKPNSIINTTTPFETETEMTSAHISTEISSFVDPATTKFDQTRTTQTPDQTPSTTEERTTVNPNTEALTTQSHITSSEQPSTPPVDQTPPVPEHMIVMRATFTSTTPLSPDDIRELVLVKFHKLLREKGLPANIKVSLRTPQK